MKKATKILAMLLAVLMTVACFAGCSDSSSTDGGDKAAKKYVIYSDKAFAPFEYYDETKKEYVGVDMDILAAIAEDQGFEYEMHNEGFDAAMGAVQAGQADAMIAGMTIRDDRKENFDFSDGYFDDGSIMTVAKDSTIASPADLKGKVVACKVSTTSTDYAESIKDQYGFAVKKGQNAELITLFNKGLANIKANGKYDEILAKYGY